MAGLVAQIRAHGIDEDTATGWMACTPYPPPAGQPAQWDTGGAFGFGGLSVRRIGKVCYISGVLTSVGRPITPGFRGARLPAGFPVPTARTAISAARLSTVEVIGAGDVTLAGVTLGTSAGTFLNEICFDKYIGDEGTTRVLLHGWWLLP